MSKKKKKRLEKQRAKQRASDSTSSTSTSTGRGFIASMAIARIGFLAALLAVLTQLGSVSFRSFPWSGILLFLLAEMSSESNQVRNCIWIVKRSLESDNGYLIMYSSFFLPRSSLCKFYYRTSGSLSNFEEH